MLGIDALHHALGLGCILELDADHADLARATHKVLPIAQADHAARLFPADVALVDADHPEARSADLDHIAHLLVQRVGHQPSQYHLAVASDGLSFDDVEPLDAKFVG